MFDIYVDLWYNISHTEKFLLSVRFERSLIMVNRKDESMEKSFDARLNDSSYNWEDLLGDIVLGEIKLRKSKGLSPEELASKAGVEVDEVLQFERFLFEGISLVSCGKILNALGAKIKI